jgi:nicotinate phosphoribosyltransferase
MTEHEGVFHLFFRRAPYGGGYTVAAGTELVRELLQDLRFDEDDLAYLATLTGHDRQPLFPAGFLAYLRQWRPRCHIDAVPEGTIVFPFQPLVRVRGPLIDCQLLETVLLNMVNFSTLIATKAARVVGAAGTQSVLEFGLRRAQGIDGGLMASRAAWIGGCAATSNVLAGKLFGIPVRGTHAHSWVMCFASEMEAFLSYAEALPNNVVLLVDTYDTLQGVRNAIEAGHKLRARGSELLGIRLDSGDLAWLSREARTLLDEARFTNTRIVASNDLDERLIQSLKQQGAAIDTWGVGTCLVTGKDQGALGGVYKLAAIRAPGGSWDYRIKVSESAIKTSIPGIHQVRRFLVEGSAVGDALFDLESPTPDSGEWQIVDPVDPTRRKLLPANSKTEDLLRPIVTDGRPLGEPQTLNAARERAAAQLVQFHEGIRRLDHPHSYPAGLEVGLHDRRAALVMAARGLGET